MALAACIPLTTANGSDVIREGAATPATPESSIGFLRHGLCFSLRRLRLNETQ